MSSSSRFASSRFAVRALLVALIVVSVAHLVWARFHVRHAPSEVVRLMPAAGGRLAVLGIQFHRVGAERFLPVFHAMLASLDRDTTVHVVVGDAEDEELFRRAYDGWFSDRPGPPIEVTRADRPITSWMRDRFAVLQTSAGPRILAPPRPVKGGPERRNDFLVPRVVAEARGWPLQVSEVQFEGGDLIADEQRAYVVPELLSRNPDLDPVAIVAVLEEELGLPVMLLEDPAPKHHIGMFLTPLGGGRVALGSCEVRPEVPDELLVGGLPFRTDPDLCEGPRNLRRQLVESGVEVVDVPIRMSTEPYVFLSYNNVVLERRGDGSDHVLLPVYGVVELDQAAVDAWKGAGFKVHPIDVSGVFRMGGSIRCLSAPLVQER